MNTFITMVTLAVIAIGAFAHPGGGGRGGPGGKGRGGWGGLAFCSCSGRRNPCTGNTGTTQLGCKGTNSYIQCTDTVCANLTCPTGQVWDSETDACAACPAGKHINAEGQRCVCDQGTTEDRKTKQCVACPIGATVEADECYCPEGLALDKVANECKACPTGTTLSHGGCRCDDATLFFNQNTWTCDACPGEWLPRTTRGSGRRGRRDARGGQSRGPQTTQECTCDATLNQIFDRKNVACYTCPTDTTAVKDMCLCALRLQRFNRETEVCECVEGFDLNPEGTACERTVDTTDDTAEP